jgi:hypothetical protein
VAGQTTGEANRAGVADGGLLMTGDWGRLAGAVGPGVHGRRRLAAGLGAQPPGLAAGGASPAACAVGAAGGAVQREQPPGGALLGGAGEPLPVHFGGELGELVHDGHLLSCRWWRVVRSTVATGAAGGHA